MIKPKSIIGRKYYPYDNSYTVNLTSSSNYPCINDQSNYLAGNLMGALVKECIIVSEPFNCIVKGFMGKTKVIEMILVTYNNCTYSVMYHENAIK